MSIWDRLRGVRNTDNMEQTVAKRSINQFHYAFVDIEVGSDNKIHDIGALKYDGSVFHSRSQKDLSDFLTGTDYICGHNIIHHDAKYLFPDQSDFSNFIDTLYLSPLLFPERPYHRLVKDDKLYVDQLNNPVNDCEKAKILLFDEITQWQELSESKKLILSALLRNKKEFEGFLNMVGYQTETENLEHLIQTTYSGQICENANLSLLIRDFPYELAYALANADTTQEDSITPGWVLHKFPQTEYVKQVLRHTKCQNGCIYCDEKLDARKNLEHFFGFDRFRTYNDEPLQENAVNAAIKGQSLLAIFPTGGGKSLTFQLPALIAGRCVNGLTVVISPLLSLMKDQVDNLASRDINNAETINGLLDPISRQNAIQRVKDGSVSLLYIAPEMLRSKTIEHILMSRNVVRFVIDEAHCFSSWGQDFRVDYLYIGKFIKEYQKQKNKAEPIPISCFTATAKQKVVQDICDYFKKNLDLDLELYASEAARTNLRYAVIHSETDEEKYLQLRNLISSTTCPTIVYASRTKRTKELSDRLNKDGFTSLPFNGKMDAEEKVANQEAFMSNKVRIIVATSAFGMGVDKKDVGMVIHYEISDSLENYVQEAGRAGRDPETEAKCYVLYNDNDLNKHFILLNQTKLSLNEIQQVWTAIKRMTSNREAINCSALEIARAAGWDDSVADIETRVKTAIATLEENGYVIRSNNSPHVYATGIMAKNMDEARERIMQSRLFEKKDIENAVRIIKSLISQKYCTRNSSSTAESRIDYLADILGLNKYEVISVVEKMRQEGILSDSRDISAYLPEDVATSKRALNLLTKFSKLEEFIIDNLTEEGIITSVKELNDKASKSDLGEFREKDLKTVLYFLSIRKYIRQGKHSGQNLYIKPEYGLERLKKDSKLRIELSRLAIDWLYNTYECNLRNNPGQDYETKSKLVQFSELELLNFLLSNSAMLKPDKHQELDLNRVEEILLYLSKTGIIQLEGGFLVLYNGMQIRRIKDSKFRYKQDDYKTLNEFYKQKMQQIHIVGEYANLMVKDYNAALEYVHDYFHMDYKQFISKYFKENRAKEIEHNITPGQYQRLFGQLSTKQMEIISDHSSRCIVVAAGPGSGKTRVLVHKLASLLLLEDVKHEQLLMLTFSRAAATEFKTRLIELIDKAAYYVEIKTFHSYCFDLLGRIGNIDEVKDVVEMATKMITSGEVEPNKIGKAVLVIDEAQDMSFAEFSLVKALMANNEDMRVIAVGDDDQNIYEFRGSNSEFMMSLSDEKFSNYMEMTDNYRSSQKVVEFANSFLQSIASHRKQSQIVSKSSEEGRVDVTKYSTNLMYTPVVQSLIANKESGSTCILTQTNEEAVTITAILHKYGIKAKLIQSLGGMDFRNIAEVRYFMKYLAKNNAGPVISEQVWKNAKEKTFSIYERSTSLVYLKQCIRLFEKSNRTKYISDFKEFLYESSIEDFCDFRGNNVIVSTIHKAKGKEFDNVYMMIEGGHGENDDLKRRLYVGITRAKNNLHIHTNSSIFDNCRCADFSVDYGSYTQPEQVVLQMTYKDVFLGYFDKYKKEILSLRGGDELKLRQSFLYDPVSGKLVGKLSAKMQDEVSGWISKGYSVKSVCVRFIVAWKPKNADKDKEETAIILADMELQKNK